MSTYVCSQTVDLASIDRRNHDLELKTFTRVENLILTYSNSAIKEDIMQSIERETMRPTTRSNVLRLFRPHPPNVLQVMMCIIG
jgi:hypothetical protein